MKLRFERFRRLPAAALLLLTAASAAQLAAADPSKLDLAVDEQIQADQQAVASQQHVDGLDDETRKLLAEYRQLQAETESLNDYSDQLGVQVRSQTGEIAFVEKQLVEIESTARDVLPMMQKMVTTLDSFVELDVPFLIDERRKRVAGLEEMLARADVAISEKYRRIIEAYQIEMDYGRTLEAYQGTLGDGDAPRTVQFLRVGRVALLYQTLDGRETGYWNAQSKSWVKDDAYRQAVKEGFAVALKQGAPDLLTVPIPAPRAAAQESGS